nr:hypothetical protein [Tanacetum cinerariifolium]
GTKEGTQSLDDESWVEAMQEELLQFKLLNVWTVSLDDESWVEAMQEELLQFKLLNVWTVVDLPHGKRAIGTKWVYRNKRDQQRIVELALMCTKFVADEKEKVDKYIGGLPDNINGNVMSARPKTLDEAIELANDLMDQKLRTYLERQTESKRKCDNNNQAQQIPKRQNVAQAYAIGTGERKEYAGTLLLCNKCKFHHNGPCTTKCANCKKVGHLTRDCWNPTATSKQKTITSYEGGNEGHYKSDCL